MSSDQLAAGYRKWRRIHPNYPASVALSYARCELEQKATLARLGEWNFVHTSEYGEYAYADIEGVNPDYTVRVLVGDDVNGVEWGDCEPTDEERDNASAFYVSIQVLDGIEEVYTDSIGGIDVIDLPGYLQRDWEDAVAFALNEYLLADAERFALNEDREREHWAARDTITV